MVGGEGGGRGERDGGYLDVVFTGIEELVNLREPSLHVPEQYQTKGRGSTHHTNTFVLVYPFVAIGNQQLVSTKASVDKTIDKGGREISPG